MAEGMNIPNVSLSDQEIADQKAIELAKDFSYDGYQVVRRELFAHMREPAVVIRRNSVTFNTACIDGLEDTVYIHLLINPELKRLVIMKAEENEKNALRWCIAKPDKRKSRKMTNKIFSPMLYDLMGWDPICRYKILGHKISYEGETIYVFDLTEPEIFTDIKSKDRETAIKVLEQTKQNAKDPSDETKEQGGLTEEELKKEIRKQNRQGYFPESWRDSFGLSLDEHQKALSIDIKDGYVEFGLKDNP